MLQARTNNSRMSWIVKTIQHINRLLNQKVFLVWSVEFKHIQTNWISHISRIKVDNILNAFFWNLTQQRFNQITVRINKGESPTIHHILISHIFLQDRFTNACLTNNIYVAAAVFCADSNRFFDSSKFVIPNQQTLIQNVCWSINLLRHLSLNL